jgi:putative tryptophan/tyrosine transport system substrate-binding protein
MKRREFIAGLGGAAAAWPLAVRAQQSSLPEVGLLHGISAAQGAERMVVFRGSLGEIGFVERRNVAIEYRWADGQFDRLPALVEDLIRRKVAVLVVGASDVAIRAAVSATKTIPIVFHTASDPVHAGFVQSISRPGGNVTGVAALATDMVGKRLELLHELVPGATKMALLVNPNNPGLTQDVIQHTEDAASRLGIGLVVLKAGTDDEIGSAIAAAAQQRVGALSISAEGYLGSRSRQIASFALRHGLPTVGGSRQGVEAGLLMGYGSNVVDNYRFIGGYVGRILKGEKTVDLPVLQPTRFELAINRTTANALGLTVPPTLLAIADEVIE